MKRTLASLVVLGFILAPVLSMAQETPASRPPPAPDQDLVLTGKLTKEDKTVKGRDGNDINITVYVLTDEKGNKIVLPQPAAPQRSRKGEPPAASSESLVKLDDFVGMNVKVTAKGHEGERGGVTTVSVTKVIIVEKIQG